MTRTSATAIDPPTLIKQAFPAWKVAVLKEIGGGNSGARVLVVDFVYAGSKNGSTGTTALEPGQYILKIHATPIWPGESPESTRHEVAVARNADFAGRHIPALRNAAVVDGASLLLYEIAGQSLVSFVGADTVDAGSLKHYCSLIASGLLHEWNYTYTVANDTDSVATLRSWLGYRLSSSEAPELHAFVAQQTQKAPLFLMAGRALIDPLWLASTDSLDVPAGAVTVNGRVHGDLHPGNILVDRTGPHTNQYWLIDFALSKDAPLGFDHAYLELALLIGHLEGAEPQRLLTIMEAVDVADDGFAAHRVAVQDSGVLDCVKTLRAAITNWQQEAQPKRYDSVAAQFRLAQVASGLNWMNKPISENRRRLALAYAAHAAKRYLETFAPSILTVLSSQERLQPEALPTISPDWSDVWDHLSRFDTTRAHFILVTAAVETCPENASLALVPWSAIIDLDPDSSTNGLHASIAPTLSTLRSLQQFGNDPISVDFDRGTAWLMANGWPSRFEPVPTSFRLWRQVYGRRIRELCGELRRATAPLPVKAIVLAGDKFPADYMKSIIDMLDESLEGSSDITVIGRTPVSGDPALAASYPISARHFTQALYQMFGGSVKVDDPTVPGIAGAVAIPVDQLRNLEEELEILHSRLIPNSIAEVSHQDAFWKGNPPTWTELHSNEDVPREIAPALARRVRDLLELRGNYTLELRHPPGSGGTTVALRCAWNIRQDFPVAVLRRYTSTTADRIDQLFRLSQKAILLIAEAATLPPAQREELYREISRRNVRCVILYIVRGLYESRNAASDHLWLTDPISDRETEDFLKAFSARTSSPRRLRALRQLSTSDELRRFRNPFLYGLTAYEEDFESVDRYVTSHLHGTSNTLRRVARFLALVTRYTQTGVSAALLNRLLGISADSRIDLAELLGESLSRLMVRRDQLVRLLHPVIAEELLKQTLGGSADWRFGLKDVALEFIAEIVEILGPDADEALHLLTELFIKRDFWTPGAKRRGNFSELILAMPTSAGQHEVLTKLTESCPDEPHFWNHLGRHHMYEMRQDFGVAEQYLLKAVELDPIDRVHHHALGMVRRFWVRSMIAEMLKQEASPSIEEMFESIEALLSGASDEFSSTRNLAPEDDHGYITHIQMIVEVLDSLIRVDPARNLAAIAQRRDFVGTWVREAQVTAEELLARVQHLRQQLPPSKYELRCVNGLATLYGDFENLVEALEHLDETFGDADIRRALATAYYSRSGRRWNRMPEHELRRTKDLMEENLRNDPTAQHDIRSWFQAYRRLPEFSFITAIDRLESWAASSVNSPDAYYYLYILHFLRWHAGTERNEDALQSNLEDCRRRAIGRRGLSYEWLGREPEWCPLVHASELGEWKKGHEFFEDTEPLAWTTGSIATIKPQTGTIRLGAQTVAHFVPGTRFSETRHLNSVVRFYLGFSYEGLRAWSVELVSVSPAEGQSKAGSGVEASLPVTSTGPRESQSVAAYDSEESAIRALRHRVEEFVNNQLTIAENRQRPLLLADLGNRLARHFGAPPIHKRFGVRGLESLIVSFAGIAIEKKNNVAIVVRSRS